MRVVVEHYGENHRKYELVMNELPENPDEYFNEVVVDGFGNWNWTGPGTAERNNYPKKDYAQIVD